MHLNRIQNRRAMLRSAAAVAGGLVATSRARQLRTPVSGQALPTMRVGSHEISRLIVGSNPFNGYCYALPSLSEHMKEWSTSENVCRVWKRCQDLGINTCQISYDERAIADIQRFQSEGGNLHWILLGGGEMKEDLSLIPKVARLGPMAIAHHGGVTDARFRKGEMTKVEAFLKRVRDAGVLVGLSTHLPQVIEFVEEKDWDIDFYMTCFYQLTRTTEEIRRQLGELPLGYVFLEKDPARMCNVIRQTRKPCLAFKILAAGRAAEHRSELESAFRYAFSNIKPEDGVIVGMYPRFKDEVEENTAIARQILTEIT